MRDDPEYARRLSAPLGREQGVELPDLSFLRAAMLGVGLEGVGCRPGGRRADAPTTRPSGGP